MADAGAGDPATDLVAHPEVDLVIAVHSGDRPIRRAVASVLDGTAGLGDAAVDLRVTVVCHDLDPAVVAERLGPLMADARLRLIGHRDGIRSPSGPFNAGLDAATAPWVSIMGSDDELESGALAAWLRRANATESAAVLPPVVIRSEGARDRRVATPPVRLGRRDRLDGVRDRLAYRSAPLGLLSRELVGPLRFGGGLPQGEDVLFSARLWFSGAQIALADGPAYVVHDDASDRVTSARPPVAVALGFIDEVVDDRWFRAQPERVRTAIAAKLLRVNVFGEFVNRPTEAHWPAAERDALDRLVQSVRAAAPAVIDLLPVADRRVLHVLPSTSGADARQLLALARARRAFGRPATLLTSAPLRALHPEAPLRFIAATVLAGRRS